MIAVKGQYEKEGRRRACGVLLQVLLLDIRLEGDPREGGLFQQLDVHLITDE